MRNPTAADIKIYATPDGFRDTLAELIDVLGELPNEELLAVGKEFERLQRDDAEFGKVPGARAIARAVSHLANMAVLARASGVFATEGAKEYLRELREGHDSEA